MSSSLIDPEALVDTMSADVVIAVAEDGRHPWLPEITQRHECAHE